MGIRGSYKWHSRSPGDGGRRTALSRRTLIGLLVTPFVRAEDPELSAFDLSLIDEPVVPPELFFVREHFPMPRTSAAGWTVSVSGAVAAPFTTSLDDLSQAPRKTVAATVECAENAVGGGLVSHAEWTGTPLLSLIQRARPLPDARFVRFSGADGFSRTIPIAKATRADTLIVQIMNGEKLPAKHGFPVRTLVPGWYGMDSVKWLRSIELRLDDDGAVSGRDGYVRLTRTLLAGTRPAGAVTTMNVKSAFSRPVDGAILMGRRFMIRGAAWAGESTVKQVEVSTDSGSTWNTAQLTTKPAEYSWVLWSFEWKIPKAGEYDLIVRATDTQGRTQSNDRPSDRVDPYELNMQQQIRVIAV